MIRVDIEEIVQRPIEDVFDRLVDIDRYAEWMPGNGLFVSSWRESGGPVASGVRYSDRTKLGTVRGEVSAFDRPTKVVFHYRARLLGWTVMEGWPGYVLERVGDAATRVRHHAEGRLYGPCRLFRPLVQRLAQGERRRTVEALKRSLDAERMWSRAT